jgi:hypothetical protein
MATLVAMQFRNHPIWPPDWSHQDRAGEIGVLKYVCANAPISNKCYLVLEHEDEKFVVSLIIDDPSAREQVTAFLRSHLGRSITEIGGLNFP